MEALPLTGRTVAVPETRELEVFATLQRRGARVLRCPLVAIRDAPEPAAVLEFAAQLAAGQFDDLILTTGEGLRRILGCLEQHRPALREPFVAALARVRKITRGPKPARALREARPQARSRRRATDHGGHYREPRERGVERPAHRRTALRVRTQPAAGRFPRRRRSASEHGRPLRLRRCRGHDASVRALIERLGTGGVDAIAFTSTPQVERLFAVGPDTEVRQALQRTLVAAVGPVVAEALRRHGVEARLMPEESFFLKLLTAALEAALGTQD